MSFRSPYYLVMHQTALKVDETLLRTNIAVLAGGQDLSGRRLVIFPVSSIPKLETVRTAGIVQVLRYYVGIQPGDGQQPSSRGGGGAIAGGYTFVADLRHVTQDGVNVFVDALVYLQKEKWGTVGVLYALKPKSRTRARLLKKLLGLKQSKKTPRIPQFKSVLLKTLTDLYNHMDRGQLTDDYGGSLAHNQDAWIHYHKLIDPMFDEISRVNSQLSGARDRAQLLQDYDTSGLTSQELATLIKDLEDKNNTIMRELDLETVIDMCHHGIQRLDRRADDAILCQIHPSFISECQGPLKQQSIALVDAKTGMLAIWKECEARFQKLLTFATYKEGATKLCASISDEWHPKASETITVAHSLSQAEHYRSSFTSAVYEPAKKIISEVTDLLQRIHAMREELPFLENFELEFIPGVSQTVTRFVEKLDKTHNDYVNIHVFYIMYDKLSVWYIKMLRFLPSSLASRVVQARQENRNTLCVPPKWSSAIRSFLTKHPGPRDDHINRIESPVEALSELPLCEQAKLLAVRIRTMCRLTESKHQLNVSDISNALTWKRNSLEGKDEISPLKTPPPSQGGRNYLTDTETDREMEDIQRQVSVPPERTRTRERYKRPATALGITDKKLHTVTFADDVTKGSPTSSPMGDKRVSKSSEQLGKGAELDFNVDNSEMCAARKDFRRYSSVDTLDGNPNYRNWSPENWRMSGSLRPSRSSEELDPRCLSINNQDFNRQSFPPREFYPGVRNAASYNGLSNDDDIMGERFVSLDCSPAGRDFSSPSVQGFKKGNTANSILKSPENCRFKLPPSELSKMFPEHFHQDSSMATEGINNTSSIVEHLQQIMNSSLPNDSKLRQAQVLLEGSVNQNEETSVRTSRTGSSLQYSNYRGQKRSPPTGSFTSVPPGWQYHAQSLTSSPEYSSMATSMPNLDLVEEVPGDMDYPRERLFTQQRRPSAIAYRRSQSNLIQNTGDHRNYTSQRGRQLGPSNVLPTQPMSAREVKSAREPRMHSRVDEWIETQEFWHKPKWRPETESDDGFSEQSTADRILRHKEQLQNCRENSLANNARYNETQAILEEEAKKQTEVEGTLKRTQDILNEEESRIRQHRAVATHDGQQCDLAQQTHAMASSDADGPHTDSTDLGYLSNHSKDIRGLLKDKQLSAQKVGSKILNVRRPMQRTRSSDSATSSDIQLQVKVKRSHSKIKKPPKYLQNRASVTQIGAHRIDNETTNDTSDDNVDDTAPESSMEIEAVRGHDDPCKAFNQDTPVKVCVPSFSNKPSSDSKRWRTQSYLISNTKDTPSASKARPPPIGRKDSRGSDKFRRRPEVKLIRYPSSSRKSSLKQNNKDQTDNVVDLNDIKLSNVELPLETSTARSTVSSELKVDSVQWLDGVENSKQQLVHSEKLVATRPPNGSCRTVDSKLMDGSPSFRYQDIQSVNNSIATVIKIPRAYAHLELKDKTSTPLRPVPHTKITELEKSSLISPGTTRSSLYTTEDDDDIQGLSIFEPNSEIDTNNPSFSSKSNGDLEVISNMFMSSSELPAGNESGTDNACGPTLDMLVKSFSAKKHSLRSNNIDRGIQGDNDGESSC